ncbi:DNA mismatch repair endonuclease MutH [Legionella micdadei]|uniref:DNA mismatch repair protein MutH n=1 Tax=Legionella micdadei TaxID=451 RepID=A0A098GEK7_LEGMI|nr:DNA mismatch repair endonuclease MutH [Legionella micdadei]ARH00152.1 DNA mismatch repair protein MutH [Legionella micdadei]KTD27611.1 DNA mismatch repair protein [Legionella micdadei]NSL17593.1 DNA mismatch repair endonuclease MutH [Legionella micdadei]CEG60904.1 DNA mismatch repair protein mutH [Legionella micdadei]SCY16742.1 DNA mismatch repair protein MutH [Legionella micdadei]
MNHQCLLRRKLNNEEELLEQCRLIEGLSFAQLADFLQIAIPAEKHRRKGWAGTAIELALGTTAGTKSIPDFTELGIELKTLPLNDKGKPAESTFVTSIPLLTIHQQDWPTSQCYAKLKRVLWLPIEGDRRIPFEHRRIGRGFLWSPNQDEQTILSEDWHELVSMIGMGRLDEIHAGIGQYLQVRPKAANAKSLCYGFDSQGSKILTLPRGFYLRSRFTGQIVKS